jgi:hypothetical protein
VPIDHASARLEREIHELRRLVDDLRTSLGARQEVTVRALERHRYLGQPVSIVATVTAGSDRAPVVDAPVTFATTWGVLSPTALNAPPRATTVTTRTAHDGAATIKLLPPISPDLLAPQRAQLIQALDLLDPTAATPRELELGLSWLANIYRWETNVDLRRAIDIAVRDLRPDLLDGINERDVLDAWEYVDALVTVYVQGQDPAASGGLIQSAAVLPVRCKDWLGPWVQIYRQVSFAANRLSDNLAWLATGQEAPARVSDRVYDRIRAHLVDQPGLIGEHTGRAIASDAIRAFLHTGAAELPPITQAALSRSLVETTSGVSEGAAVLSAVGTLRADVREDVAAKADVFELTSLAESVDGKLEAKVDLGTFEEFRVDATTAFASKVDTSALDTALATKVDAAAFAGFRAETGEALDQRATIDMLEDVVRDKVDVSVFEAQIAAKADLSVVEAGLAAKVDLGTFQEELATKVDSATFDRALSQTIDADALTEALTTKVDATEFETALRDKVDSTTFDRFQDEFRESSNRFVTTERLDEVLRTMVDTSVLDERLAAKADLTLVEDELAAKADVDTLERGLATKVDTATFDQRLETKVDSTTLDQRLAAKVDATTLDQRLASKVDTTTFNTSLSGKVDRTTFQTILATKVDRASFDTTVARLRTDATRVRTRIDTNIDNR